MDGVNIQYVESLTASNNLVMIMCMVVVIFIFVAGSMAAAILVSDDRYLSGIGIIVFMFVLASLFIYGGRTIDERPDKNYYVTLDENVDVTQFYDKYDVIERKGDIWIVQEKVSD